MVVVPRVMMGGGCEAGTTVAFGFSSGSCVDNIGEDDVGRSSVRKTLAICVVCTCFPESVCPELGFEVDGFDDDGDRVSEVTSGAPVELVTRAGRAVFLVEVLVSGGGVALDEVAVVSGNKPVTRVCVTGATGATLLIADPELNSDVLFSDAFVVVAGASLVFSGANPVRDVAMRGATVTDPPLDTLSGVFDETVPRLLLDVPPKESTEVRVFGGGFTIFVFSVVVAFGNKRVAAAGIGT